MSQKKKQGIWILRLLGVGLLTGILLFWIVADYANAMEKRQLELADRKLGDIAAINASDAYGIFIDKLDALAGAATGLEAYDDFTSPEAIEYIKRLSYIWDCERLAINFPEGQSYTSDGRILDSSSYGYGEKIAKGESFITDILPALTDQSNMVHLFYPLRKDGLPVASLRYAISTDGLAHHMPVWGYKGQGYYLLLDSQGKYISRSNNLYDIPFGKSFYDFLANLEFLDEYSIEDVKENMAIGREGLVKFRQGNDNRFARYVPVGINNWYMVIVVPERMVLSDVTAGNEEILSLFLKLMLLFVSVFAYIFWGLKKRVNQGELDEKCFRILAQQTKAVTLVWSYVPKFTLTTTQFSQVFGWASSELTSIEQIIEAGVIHPDDELIVRQVYGDIIKGKPISAVRFRVKPVSGNYLWCKMIVSLITDKQGKPYKAIGTLENIDMEIQEAQDMQHKAVQDSVTGRYNKMSTLLLMESTLQKPKRGTGYHALMAIDIDNFKWVNETLGHQIGDYVIGEVGKALKRIIRATDIIGHMDGDNFLGLMLDAENRKQIESRARILCESLNAVVLEDGTEYKISISIGIAVISEAVAFEHAYQVADIALYEAKNKGKNTFHLLDVESKEGNPAGT